ncbi:MAG: asparaginase [Neisseriaceae bacterium]|jgi:L-asparaginase|nr:MAG: asparaginase [Neisseriaceae bacterium]
MKRIIIHGGCGAREEPSTPFEAYHEHLLPIIKQANEYLEKTNDAVKTALLAARLLEDDTIFNAGTGSRVQQDGQIRMSASYMDSKKNKFSGVINIQNVQYPSEVAFELQKQHHSILSGEHATNHAYQKLKMKPYNPMTDKRWNEYLELKKGLTGTIGVVVLDDNGVICAITSTGGAGFEVPGRVGDSPTVAGNFASKVMGISCTGIGEEIVNKSVAAKVHTRVLDGANLNDAINKSVAESNVDGDYVGMIAIDALGNVCTGTTTVAQTLYAYYDGKEYRTFLQDL